ncbi:MAG: HtaA domain-containing protein, partial [Microbacteriaceae bacterium]|nr:HtaA domain-containing protein [Microbacteriaceae bacterium]
MSVRRALALASAAAAAGLAIGGFAVLAPSAQAPASAASCQVTDARIDWGFKASFRAYITSSIAHGDWTTSGGADYATPNFIWSGGSGTFDAAATGGEVAFPGAVHFTGHDGMLDSTFSNLRLRFSDASSAVLVVDYIGVSMDEALAGSSTPTTYPGVPFVALALGSGARGDSGSTTTFTAVPTSITGDGSAAFGSYESGTAFDPMTISITTDAECGAPPPAQGGGGGAGSGSPAGGAGGSGTPGAASGSTSTGPSIVAATGLQIPTAAPTATSTPTPRATSAGVVVDDEPAKALGVID